MALGIGLVIATLVAVHYHAQANGLRHLPRSPHSPVPAAAAALPRVSSSTVALLEDGPIRGKVAIVMVDRIPGGNAELLIMAYISGGRAHTRYALMGSNCLSNSADHLWASGVTDDQGSAVLTGRPWTSNSEITTGPGPSPRQEQRRRQRLTGHPLTGCYARRISCTDVSRSSSSTSVRRDTPVLAQLPHARGRFPVREPASAFGSGGIVIPAF